MTDLLLQIGFSNLLISLMLAILAWIVHATGKRPMLAHVLWLLVLAKLITPPIVMLPVVPLPEFARTIDESFIDEAAGVASSTDLLMMDNAESQTLLGESALTFDSLAATSSFIEQVKTGLIGLWALGSVLVLTMSLVRIYRFNRLLNMACEVAPPELQSLAAELSKHLGLKSAPMLCTTSAHLSPMVWWIGRRVRILIPDALPREMEPDQLRWILAHELAHIKRRDHLVRWLEWFACIGFWWNPVAWWARRNLRINEEICCDQLVLSSLHPKPQTYANALMNVVEFLASPALRPPAVASEITSGGFLERRFKMIVSNSPITRTQRWLRASVLFGAVGLLPLGVSSVSAAPQDATNDQRAADKSDDSNLLDILSTLVANKALDGEIAFEIYMESMKPKTKELIESGKANAEAIDKRLAMGFKYAVAEAEVKQLVADGTISEEDAKARLQGVRKSMAGQGERDKARPDAEVPWRRIGAALLEAGIEEEQIRTIIGAMGRIAAEINAEGEDFELSPRMLVYLEEEQGLTEEQIQRVVRLSYRVAAAGDGDKAKRDDARSNWENIRKRIEGAVERGNMTREEADTLYRQILQRMAGDQQGRSRDR